MEVLEKLFKKHKDWCAIVASFGCDRDYIEDVVQDMYLKIGKLVEKGTDISYGEDDINHWYVYKTLTSIYLDYVRRNKRIARFDFDLYDSHDSVQVNYAKYYNLIETALNELYWYDKQVYSIIDSGVSVRQLSKDTNIAYHSLYNTYRKVKKHLRSKINPSEL